MSRVMDVFEAIEGRRSVRRFKEKEVAEEEIKRILGAALWAPSAGNLGSRKFFVVRSREVRKQLARAAYGQEFVYWAPVVIVVCADFGIKSRYGERGASLYCLQDCAAAIQNMMLAAHALGFGSCWVGAFDEEMVREILKLKPNLRPVALVPIGYPDESPSAPRRADLKESCEFI